MRSPRDLRRRHVGAGETLYVEWKAEHRKLKVADTIELGRGKAAIVCSLKENGGSPAMRASGIDGNTYVGSFPPKHQDHHRVLESNLGRHSQIGRRVVARKWHGLKSK